MLEQQSQQAQYYDKLLHHLNRTFAMNMKAQELFLDMSRHTKTIRFKSIKNIYNTLTEGKADEVIYQKDKTALIAQHVFNQKFTQRTCWRIIEKLVAKVSYFLSNEHLLAPLAPSLLRALAFLRTANQKVNNRASFVQFFEEVLDCIIRENNLLEEKIYELLIKRGYIYSIDEFYRLNRFEGPHADYVCPEDEPEPKEEEDYSLEVAGKSIDTSSVVLSKKSRSRFGVISSKRSALHGRSRTNMEEQSNIPEEQAQAEGEGVEGASPQCEDGLAAEQVNRLSHNIHQQVERTVDELLNDQQFSSYMDSNRSEEHVSSLHDSAKPAKPLVRQLLKNLRNRNFKANQKILVINSAVQKEEERKNSSQTLLKKKRMPASLQKNRTSIAMALNKGMRERIFRNEHLADIEDLIIDNLDRLEGGDGNESKGFTRGPNKKNIFFRSKARQQTQTLPIHNEEATPRQPRRASNFQLPSTFAFQNKNSPKHRPDHHHNHLNNHRTSNFAPEYHMSEVSSNRTIGTASYQDQLQRMQLVEQYVSGRGSGKEGKGHRAHRSHLSGASLASRFATAGEREAPPKQNRFFCPHSRTRNEEFNPTLLKITAQKYNKCVTEQPEAIRTLELRELNVLTAIDELINFQSATSIAGRKPNPSGTAAKGENQQTAKKEAEYSHGRKFEVYDRKMRRIL